MATASNKVNLGGMKLELKALYGRDIAPHLSSLAKLRITIFKEYPYLYDGNLTYEEKYLKRYSDCEDALIIMALDEGTPAGMSSCLPMAYEDEFRAPFLKHQIDVNEVFYFGESILLPKYRGHGIGKRFFTLREEHAKSILGDHLKYTAFCAVNRQHKPPKDYQSPEPLWLKRGYQKYPDLVATYHWKDIGDDEETPKTLTFWLKEHS